MSLREWLCTASRCAAEGKQLDIKAAAEGEEDEEDEEQEEEEEEEEEVLNHV